MLIFVPLGGTQSVVETADGVELKSNLIKANRKEFRSMLGRMGRIME